MTDKVLVFDIETFGGLIDDEPLCQSNKDYLHGKIEKKRAVKDDPRTDEDKERDFCGLDVDLAKVICIGLYDGKQAESMVISDLKDEKALIQWFWDKIVEHNPQKLVTFNGKTFDVPIMVRRTAFYRIPPIKNFLSLDRYPECHLDVGEKLSQYYPANMKKRSFYVDYYTISKEEDENDGSEIRQLFLDGKTLEIVRKCEKDVKTTYGIYDLFKPFFRR